MADSGPTPLLDSDAVCAWLGVPRKYLHRLTAERRIPFYKIGGLLRFDPDEVEAWLGERHTPMAEDAA